MASQGASLNKTNYMKNIVTRTISGAVYVVLISFSILFSSYSYIIFFSIITGIALWEFYNLLEKNQNSQINKPIATIGGIYLFVSGYLYFSGIIQMKFIALWFIIMLSILILELFKKGDNAIRNISNTFLGQIYIALPLMFLSLLGLKENFEGTMTYNPILLISFFSLIWIYDTGAYIFGVTFGKHRLFERISPKKSWEGAIGGAIVAMAASIGINYLFPGNLSMIQWLGFSLITVVFGTFGDLVESMIKRSMNVKDSGNIIPGHGGILDRIDSSLLAAPAVVIYYLYLT